LDICGKSNAIMDACYANKADRGHRLCKQDQKAAAVAACEPAFSRVAWTRAAVVPAGAPYMPGEFYLRELPPLRAVIPAALSHRGGNGRRRSGGFGE
jgi:deoxyinosine 3'endonuclease (endonuclease V)